jgi:hypothetical protein
MFTFLQTHEGLKITAFVTTLVIFIALALGVHPFKKREHATVADLWDSEDYYKYLVTVINASRDMDELETAMELIEGYYSKRFRLPMGRFARNRTYIELLELYKIPVELCQN